MFILQSNTYEQFKKLIIDIVNMCKRNMDNGRLSEKEVQKLWFSLLDKIVVPLRELFASYLQASPDQQFVMMGTPKEEKVDNRKKRKQEKSVNEDNEDNEEYDISETDDFFSDDEDMTIEENIKDHKEMIESAVIEKEKLQEKVRYEFDPLVIKSTDEKIKKIEKKLNSLRGYLHELEVERKKEEERQIKESNNPYAPKNMYNRPSNLFLQVCLNHLLKLVFTEMSNSSSSINDNAEPSHFLAEEKNDPEKKNENFSVFHLLQQAARNYKRDFYGYFKEPLLEMYDKCGFELMLYHSINSLLSNDGYWLVRRYVKRMKRGVRPQSDICRLCDSSIYELDEDSLKGGKLKVFFCGHALHEHCLEDINCMTHCPICHHNPAEESQHKSVEKKKSMSGSSLLHNYSLEAPSEFVVSAYKRQRLKKVEQTLDKVQKERQFLLDEQLMLMKRLDNTVGSGYSFAKSLRYGSYLKPQKSYSSNLKRSTSPRNSLNEIQAENEDKPEYSFIDRIRMLSEPVLKKTLTGIFD